MKKELLFSACLVLLNFLLESRGSQQANIVKDYRVQQAYDCQPDNASFPARLTDMKGIVINGSFFFNGKIHILELMPMNIELELGLTRCNIDKTGCNAFDKMIFPRICEKMGTKTSIAYKITKGISPTPKCPFAVGDYELTNNSSMSLDIFKLIPFDGFLWKLRCAFYEKRGQKRVRPIACVEYEVAVVNKSRRPKTNH